ncbi:MAG TPA: hypothetical protein VJT31_11045 [Rugosimonospora sp.]|nr:hypothetical protein [Rugosimonospora sp.]
MALSLMAPVSRAHAESGRRICRYVWNQSVGNPDRRLVSFVVDYKKDGACPDVDPHKVYLPPAVGSWMPPPDTWEHAPVPKMTCEEFQTLLNLPASGSGGDPCTYMYDDRFYAVTSSMPGDTGNTQRIWDLGSVWDLGY